MMLREWLRNYLTLSLSGDLTANRREPLNKLLDPVGDILQTAGLHGMWYIKMLISVYPTCRGNVNMFK